MKKFIILAMLLIFSVQAAAAADYDVVVTRGDILVDSLVAQVYTQDAEIPLITVNRGGLTEQARTELRAYSSQGNRALIIGGEQAVPAYIERDIKSLNYTVERLWDWTRYGTAARVAVTLWENSDSVVVAADYDGNLMAGAQTAMEDRVPLLLTETGRLNEETKQAILELGASRIILVGEVSEEVRGELSELGGIEQTRFTILRPNQPDGKGLFVIGIVVGSLVIFLISSLWGAGFIKKKTSGVPYDIFEEDEKAVIDVLMKNGNITQHELMKQLKLSHSKISRVTSELEERGIIEKKRSGKTFILILKRKIVT